MIRLQFEWIHGGNSFVSIDTWPIFEGNVVVSSFSKPCQSLLLSAIVLNDTHTCT